MAERLLMSTKPLELPAGKPPQKLEKPRNTYPLPKSGGAFYPTILATKVEKAPKVEEKWKKKVPFSGPPPQKSARDQA